jgi:hypothetical protein
MVKPGGVIINIIFATWLSLNSAILNIAAADVKAGN